MNLKREGEEGGKGTRRGRGIGWVGGWDGWIAELPVKQLASARPRPPPPCPPSRTARPRPACADRSLSATSTPRDATRASARAPAVTRLVVWTRYGRWRTASHSSSHVSVS
jgi:hypothetical protein